LATHFIDTTIISIGLQSEGRLVL